MNEQEKTEGSDWATRMRNESAPCSPSRQSLSVVPFNRHELREIMNLYGKKVAEGEWRDYALDFLPERAVFSVYRRTSETPLFRIEKHPRLTGRQGAYCVVASSGFVLKRGDDLRRVLAVLGPKPKLALV